jgi:hypothetical protein
MGYGEFGGGGSVKWVIKHNKGTSKNDMDDAPETGVFWVQLPDGSRHGPFPIDKYNPRQIRIAWTPDTLDTIPVAGTAV